MEDRPEELSLAAKVFLFVASVFSLATVLADVFVWRP